MVNQKTENQQIINNIVDELELNPATDIIPVKVNPNIQPTFEVMKKVCRVVRSAQTTSTGSTIFTTPSNSDFLLVSAQLSYEKDVAQDTATGRCNLGVVIDGTAQNVLSLPLITLTAQSGNATLHFKPPIRCDRNTAISTSRAASTAGVMNLCGNIVGYTEEANNQFATG